ncbi:uncharacterized protein LY79DRAFT_670878 [Colletotrichum navitas]|uniref:Uncharacterized protein n=1 Tax=Colletotrichum navitas TaxID=681940 RepID=A0AAD8PVY8_9PEZI|nr:uncharacterized protein LY79DRAFT_670878 [Colletotrichum navitas]KAK1585677.1 hypothetical protein LY79DRAFT_670878 [Colletotrichum navitas]
MSSLGLPDPSNTPHGDAALHRSWNRFLDDHSLRAVFQASPAQIDEQCADAIAALRASGERRAAVGDAILRLWDSIGLVVDCLPPDVNPHWRAEEQLLKPTALRLAARRARLAEEERERERLREGFWDPISFTLDMSVPSKTLEASEGNREKGEGKDESETTLEVATSLANTEYFLGHCPGDPIFSYDRQPTFRPADERNFIYRGRVPRRPGEDLPRLQLLLPRVLAQLVVLLAFFPENPSLIPVECARMMGEVDNLEERVFRMIRNCWRAKFGAMSAAAAAPYMHFLRSSPLVRELAWLVCAACLDERCHRLTEEARRARRLWTTLLPVVDVLTSDRTEGTSACEALLRIAKLHVQDEDRRARDMVFKEGEYGRALVYREGILINKSIHAFYSSYTGRLRPAAGVLLRPNPHPIFPAESDPDGFDTDPVPIPDEVLAAYESIRARHELPPEANVDVPAPLPEQPSRTETTTVVRTDRRRRRPEDKDAVWEPPRKRARR